MNVPAEVRKLPKRYPDSLSAVMPALRLALLAAALCVPLLQGCAVATVAGAAAGAVISVGAAVVSTGVKVTGKVGEKTIDAVSDDEDDD